MTHLERQISRARFRLDVNRWLCALCRGMARAACVFASVTLFDRLYGWGLPLGIMAGAVAALVLIVSIIWTAATRVAPSHAAVVLDEAAGLRERLSSGLYCLGRTDPFERAVRAEAESASARLTVEQHIALTTPRPLRGALLAVCIAAALTFLPPGILARAYHQEGAEADRLERTAAVINKRTDRIKRRARTNPALRRMAEELDKLPAGEFDRPTDLRHVALKKLDRMRDVLKQQRGNSRFRDAKEFKKMLRALKPADSRDTPVNQLAKALAKGDFQAARRQIDAMRKQLAHLKPEDAEKRRAMQQQIEHLAKRIEALANDQKLIERLRQAGLNKQDVERMLKDVTAKDIEQITQQLEKQGLNQEAIRKLVQQLQDRVGADAMARKLAAALNQSAEAMAGGSPDEAAAGLDAAGGQLDAMEMLEQEMNEIDSLMAELRDAENDLGSPCPACDGTGMIGDKPCGRCNGTGSGGIGPNMGRGRGGIAREEKTSAGFAKHRAKTHTGRGAIIGRVLVDGAQVRGNVSPDMGEILAAGQREATEAIDRARIPRRYHEAVKGYFSDVQRDMEGRSRGTRHPGGDGRGDSGTRQE